MSNSGRKSDASTVTAKSTRSYKKKSMGPVGQSKADSSKKQMPKSVVPKNLGTKQGPKAIVQSKTKDVCKKSGPKTIKGAPVKKQPIETKKIPASLDEEEKAAREGPFGWQTLVQPETKIINRNFYEEVSASDKKPDDREHEGVTPPTSNLMPAKKKTPEPDQKLTKMKTPQTDSERYESEKNHPYEKVTPREWAPDGWSESDRESGSDRNPPKKKTKSVSERKVPKLNKRHVCKGAIVLMVVFVLACVSCLVVFLAMRGKGRSKAPANQTSETDLDSSTDLPRYEGEAATFFEGVCTKMYPNVNRSCLAGSPPSRSCSGNGMCTRFAYRATFNQQSRQWQFSSNTTTVPSKVVNSRNRQLCKTVQDRLGVCSEDGQCDHLYKGQDEGSWYEEAQWEDSCDVPNPCWDDTRVLGGQSVNRENCRDKSTLCFPDHDAIVWMQHLRCKIGKNRTISGGCTGLPMRLWLCKECTRSSGPRCSGDLSIDRNECSFTCESGSIKDVNRLPDGHLCNYSANPKALAYCFEGQCFPVHDNVSDTKPMKLTDCNRM